MPARQYPWSEFAVWGHLNSQFDIAGPSSTIRFSYDSHILKVQNVKETLVLEVEFGMEHWFYWSNLGNLTCPGVWKVHPNLGGLSTN